MKRFDPYLPVLGVIGLIVLWYVAVWAQVVDPVLLPPPTDTFRAMWTGMTRGKLGSDFMHTVERTVYATVIAAVIAIPLGILLGASERLYRSVEFVIDFFRSTPASAMFPLFLVLFGVGDRDQDLGGRVRRGAGHPVQRCLRGDECAQDAAACGQGDGRVAPAHSDGRHAAGVAAADLRRPAQRRVAGAGHRGGGRNVHRLHRRPRQPGVRGAAAVRHARHVRGHLRRRRAGLWPQPAVPSGRAALRPLGRANKGHRWPT